MTNQDKLEKQAEAALRLAELKLTLSEILVALNRAHIAVQAADLRKLPAVSEELNGWLDYGLGGQIDKAICAFNAYEEVAANPNPDGGLKKEKKGDK